MDERRFDCLTRELGQATSRRSLVGVLVAAVAALRGRGAVAQVGEVPLGGACINTAQCAQDSDVDVIFCDDNGYAYDGELNCCRYAGFCDTDEHCCGDSFCYQGLCTTTAESDSSDRGAGEACTSDEQCQAASGTLYCDDNGLYDDGSPLHCCAYEGDRCAGPEGCCGFLDCVEGFCTAFPEGGGALYLGEACTVALDCSGGGDFADCAYNGIASEPVCCLLNGQGCGFDSDCCATDTCYFDSFEGGGRCVQYYGGYCLSDAGCAGDLICRDGYCQEPS